MRHPSRGLMALFTATLLIAAACGGGGESTTAVASLSDGGGDTTDTADAATPDGGDAAAPENPEDAFALFDECMSEAGFNFATSLGGGGGLSVQSSRVGSDPHEPDPQGGSISIDDFDVEAFEAANSDCQGHLANVDAGFDLTPEQEVAFDDAQLEWSECMREQGVDVPDFSGATSGAIVVEGSAELTDDPQAAGDAFFDEIGEEFEAAAEICQAVFEGNEELDGLFDESSP
jgi:hypothetical protein